MIKTKVSATGEDWQMLEPKDLRIGNVLLYKDKFVHVTSLSLDIDDEYEDTIGFCEVGKNTNEHADWNRSMPELKSVPLTPERLEKTSLKYTEGFDDAKGWEIKPGIWLSRLSESEWYIGYEIEENDSWHSLGQICEPFKYLHQFQNIFFALTGEELPVNL